jgi:hypothetical protein
MVPISNHELINMRLITGKDDKIQDFTMQYRDENVKQPKHPDIKSLYIRSDYGHGKDNPHVNIEYLDANRKKIHSRPPIPLEENFGNYEAAINLILKVAEQNNPLVGASYWLSPVGVHDNIITHLSMIKV